MADIAAADVSAVILRRSFAGNTVGRGSQQVMDVTVRITVDPGTDDAYPTGGIPLTNLFTAGNASDTGLDVSQPISEQGSGMARISSGVTVTTPALFHNGGVTAASQVLVLQRIPDDAANAVCCAQYANTDVTAAGGIAAGDTDIVYTTTLRGIIRPGFTELTT